MIKDLFDLNDFDEFKNELKSLIYRKDDFNTVIFADIEMKFRLMELEAIRILIDDCERLIKEDAAEWKQVPYMT